MTSKEKDIDDILNFIESDAPANQPKKLTKAQLKRQKKKSKKSSSQPKLKPQEITPKEGKNDSTEEIKNPKKQKKKDKKSKSDKKSNKTGQSAIAIKILEKKKRLEEEKKRLLELEEERKRIEEEEEANAKAAEEERLAKIKAKREEKRLKIEQAKKDGTYLTPSQIKKQKAAERAREQFIAAGMVRPDMENSKTPKKKVNKKKKSNFSQILFENSNSSEKLVKNEEKNTKNENNLKKSKILDKNAEKTTKIEDNLINSANSFSEKEEILGENKSEKSDSDSPDLGNWDDYSSESSISSENEKTPNLKINEKDKNKENCQKSQKIEEKKINLTKKEQNKNDKNKKINPFQNPQKKSNILKNKSKLEKSSKTTSKVSKTQKLRSPICCVLGHVDTGKTKLLDKMRSSSVQDNEVGGITQQIGASFFPKEYVFEATKALRNRSDSKPIEIRLPGLLVIDTPGHESFSNLRKRGSTLCDIAVLVVDIMHGIEPQTEESLRLLKAKKTPFVVALNKIDKIFEWERRENEAFITSFENQGEDQKNEFHRRLNETKLQINSLGLNCELYFKNTDFRNTVSIVPTSAFSGEGLPDLLDLLVRLTQQRMASRLQLSDRTECSVLEVRTEEGLGYTADVILSDGSLSTGDRILLCGINGPIDTQIKSLYQPAPLKETRFKGEFKLVKSVKAAAGVKICAPDLDQAVAGSSLVVYKTGDDLDFLKDEVMSVFTDMHSKLSSLGVLVQSSTLGSLEAFLDYLQGEKIPVSKIALGPVRKKDVIAASVMVDRKPQFACILAFNVKVDKEIELFSESLGVKIFKGEIIYNLRDFFVDYLKEFKQNEQNENAKAIFPVMLSIIPEHIIMKHNPIILGCKVDSGRLAVGTPLVALKTDSQINNDDSKSYISIGRVESIELDKKSVKIAKLGQKVAVKIVPSTSESHVYYGRQFNASNKLCSQLTRGSIDALKESFKEELSGEEWKMVIRLKKVFGIV